MKKDHVATGTLFITIDASNSPPAASILGTCTATACLKIECDVNVIKEPQVTVASEVHVSPSDLELLESEGRADVTFSSVYGEDFPAHKFVLIARTSKAELYPPALLHFVHTDSMPATDDLGSDGKNEMVMHLLVAVDRHSMERLKLILDVENVATTVCLADQHNCATLKDACIEYINSSDRVNGDDKPMLSSPQEHVLLYL
ncbi:hypothetical protein EJB05_08966, partial [Eragrostis curvula]